MTMPDGPVGPINEAPEPAAIPTHDLAQRAIDGFLNAGFTQGPERNALLKEMNGFFKDLGATALGATALNPVMLHLLPHMQRVREIMLLPESKRTPEIRDFERRVSSLIGFSEVLLEQGSDPSRRDVLQSQLLSLIPREKSASQERREKAREKRRQSQK